MSVVITNAGLQAIVNAEQTGTAPVIISHIAFGSGRYTPSANQNALQSEIKRLQVISGGTSSDNSIHVACQDSSDDSYTVYEWGAFLSDGTLFAVDSQQEAILQKSIQALAQFEIGIALAGVNVESISFGNVSFSYPYATAENAGISEFATNEETQEGTDSRRSVTPAGLNSRTATATKTGLVELATNEETITGSDSTRAVTPAGLKATLVRHTPSSASENTAGIMAIATQTETNNGNIDNKAVTPKKLKASLPSYAGTFNSATVTATGANTNRTIASHFADNLSPLDFGAKGDSTTNDTAAFTTLETAFTGRDVNLSGKTYLVTTRPTANNYYNGFFKIGTVTIKPVYDFFKFGGTAEGFINTRRDFLEFTRGGGLLLAGDFIRAGSSDGNVVQSVVADPVNRYFYSLHVDGAEKAVINRFPVTKLGGKMTIDSTAYSLPSEYVGHQGLGIEYLADGTVKLWGSFAYEGISSSTIASKGTKAVRFNPPTGSGSNIDSGIEIFNLFEEVAGSSQAVTVCTSYSGKYLIAKYNLPGFLFKVRIFKLSDLTSAGDYSKKYIHEFEATFTRDASGGETRALQGIACDDHFIYFLATGTGMDENHSIYIYDMYGNKVDEFRNLSVGKEIGNAVGTTFYEPESLFFTEINGTPKLCIQIATGDTAGDRLCHIIALNCKQSYYFGTGLSAASQSGVSIDEAGRMLNVEGNKNISLWPSGLSTQSTGREGVCQQSLMRFSNDGSSPNLVMLKSRGATYGDSVAVNPGDSVAAWHALADNGNIDYNESVQGARVGGIVFDVDSDSTISSAGNTNIGIKGVVEITANTDGASRTGRGVFVRYTDVSPSNDNALSCGASARRWSAVYAASGTIQTSDENYKEQISDISESVLRAWSKVNFVVFKFKESVKNKGPLARFHIGLIAQRIIAAFESEQISALDYGLICLDKTKDGNEIYSLRYDECLCLECAYQRYLFEQILFKLK